MNTPASLTPAGEREATVSVSCLRTGRRLAHLIQAARKRPILSMSRSSEGAIRSEGGAPEALTPQRGKQQCNTLGVTSRGGENPSLCRFLGAPWLGLTIRLESTHGNHGVPGQRRRGKQTR